MSSFSLRISLPRCVVSFAAIAIHTSLAYALPLQIFDCNGTSRASTEVSQNARTELRVDVRDSTGQPVNQGEITLTNAETGEVISASSFSEGQAIFQSVPPGNWILGAKDSNLKFSSISLGEFITPVAAYSAAVGAIVAGGGGIAGATVAISNSSGGSGNNDGSDGTDPEPTPIPTPNPEPTVCPNCNPDDTPEPIDNFFDKQKSQIQAQQKSQHSKVEIAKNAHGKAASDCFIGDDVTPMSPFR